MVLEPSDSVQSVALRWLLPAGSATDSPESQGHSTLLSELIFRGAGKYNSRQHSDALDLLGVQRSSSVLSHHIQLSATMLSNHLLEALGLVCAMVTDPSLPDQALEPVRSLCLQQLTSLEDEPQHLVMLRLNELHLTSPFNRSGYGDAEALENSTIQDLRDSWSRLARPGGSILSIAGRFDPDVVCDRLDALLRGWSQAAEEPAQLTPAQRGRHNFTHQSSQVHIGLAFDAPPASHDDSMLEHLAIGVLSGSTSGRLFTEVRQKRSLCYSVGASYRGGRDTGMVSLYAGTTPERAQETLDVSVGEILKLKQGATKDEFQRIVTGLKSHLIMMGESTPARASTIGHDYFRLGRARTLQDVAAEIDAISLDQLNDYLARREFGAFTIVSIGPVQLNNPLPQPVG